MSSLHYHLLHVGRSVGTMDLHDIHTPHRTFELHAVQRVVFIRHGLGSLHAVNIVGIRLGLVVTGKRSYENKTHIISISVGIPRTLIRTIRI